MTGRADRLGRASRLLSADRSQACAPILGTVARAAGAARKAHERDKRAKEARLRGGLAPWLRETGLAGWACKTRTQKCCCKISL
jgi:hypothetical protein